MTRDLKAVFLTEAGSGIGYGHLSRCTALYDAFQEVGCDCSIFADGSAPSHIAGDRCVEVCAWRAPGVAASLVDGAIGVVDSYLADADVYAAVAQSAGVPVYLDDTSRLAYPPGLLVNGAPNAADLYAGASEQLTLLVGTRYQALRREFQNLPKRQVRGEVGCVFVVAGGIDAGGTTSIMIEAARAVFPEAAIDAVRDARDAGAMARAVLAADVAVSAAGQTLYELAASGLPTVAVCVAENQRDQASAFANAGAAVVVDLDALSLRRDIEVRLSDLIARERRASMADAAQALVDGQGARRVARRAVGELLAARIRLEVAGPSDEKDLLMLANETSVRKASFSSRPITPEAHHSWFCRRLADPAAPVFLAWDEDVLVAYVRFDPREDASEISIAIAPQYRGFNLATGLIRAALNTYIARGIGSRRIMARVMSGNESSRRSFEHSGFLEDPQSPEQYGYHLYWRSL